MTRKSNISYEQTQQGLPNGGAAFFNVLIFGFGLLFPMVAWLLQLSKMDLFFSIGNIIFIHQEVPVMLIVDTAPFILFFLSYYVNSRNNARYLEFQQEVQDLENRIKSNIELARSIGNLDVQIQDSAVDVEDELANSLLLMHKNLRESNAKEYERNWIARGKEQIADILRKYNTIDTLAFETLYQIIKYSNMIQGAFYIYEEDKQKIRNLSTYAYNRRKFITQEFSLGQGLIGQAAFELEMIYRTEIPNYFVSLSSGLLGDKKPKSLLIVPLKGDDKLQGIIEIASLEPEISELTIRFFSELSDIIGQTLFNLKANKRTEQLLNEAQTMTEELRRNEDTLKRNADEMRRTQDELQESNKNLGAQIQKVENAQKRMHSLLENASEVISIYDEYGIVVYESPSVKSILGYAPDEVVGKNAFNTDTIVGNQATKKIFYELLDHPEQSITFEFEYEKRGGELIWLESTARNLIQDPSINGILFNTRDITVRKIAEKAQRLSGQMAALSENSPDLIMRLSPDGTFYYANPIVRIYTGLQIDDIINRKISEVGLNLTISKFLKTTIDKVLKTEEKHNDEFDFPARFGNRIMHINAIPEFSEGKKIESILLVANDITERKQIELEIEQKNKNITESINYAYRIQSAILPDTRLIQKYLPNSFIYYRPRDIVSGDFPWFFKKNDDIFIAAVDCTGHGVPGALLSLIGYFLLNNIVDHDKDVTAGEALDELHVGVRKTLRQDTGEAYGRDGMDIALCKINFTKMQLQYAGAHRPLYMFKDRELKQYKGNSKAIGGIPDEEKEEPNFINHMINITPGDKIFFFSDGLPDQIGGPRGRKYQAIRIRSIIEENPDFNMEQFADFFARDYLDWKGDNKQIDDVLLIGVEI